VLLRPSNRQEMAFKLKSAEQPFALIKIGDISGWLKEELEGYEIMEGYEDEGFFRRLNEEDSPINILMGSRTFYEGWDSNRPNVITYINIGTGTNAKKFILQSVGRGVRIEPLPGYRRRLSKLYNAGLVDEEIFRALKDQAPVLETLFIFGTNRKALQTVIEQLDQEKRRGAEHELALVVNDEAVAERLLLIPMYREAGHAIVEERTPRKFEIAAEELDQLKQYVYHLADPRLLVVRHNAAPNDVALLTRCLSRQENYFVTQNGRRYGRMDLLLSRLFAYFKVIPQEADGFKPLKDEIRHFRHIKVFLKDITKLQTKIQRVEKSPWRLAELQSRYEARQLSFDEMVRQVQTIRSDESFSFKNRILHIKRIARHYYVPVLIAENERIDWIRHVIRHQSEMRFLNSLEQYLENESNSFDSLDWWVFSKIDETLDEVFIPYYDPKSNRIRRFFPDFVFWMQNGTEYAIVFVDPKGMQQTDYQHKIDGYRDLFWNDSSNRPKDFAYKNLTVRVYLLFYTRDANQAPKEYQVHWFDNISQIVLI